MRFQQLANAYRVLSDPQPPGDKLWNAKAGLADMFFGRLFSCLFTTLGQLDFLVFCFFSSHPGELCRSIGRCILKTLGWRRCVFLLSLRLGAFSGQCLAASLAVSDAGCARRDGQKHACRSNKSMLA